MPSPQARAWSQASLEQGSALAGFVSRRLMTSSTAFVVAPEGNMMPELDDGSRSIDPRHADHLMGEYLRYLSSLQGGALIVEDDTAREGDPWLGGAVIVVGRVLRWEELHANPSRLTQLVRRGASGYPLNAFVCDEAGRAILQRAGNALSIDDASSVAESVRVIVNSVYDAESYLVIDLAASM